MMTMLSNGAAVLASIGIAYVLTATVLTARFAARPPVPVPPATPISVLKPLHGGEPRLAANLAAFVDQDWPAPVQLLAGVASADDAATAAIAAVRAAHPEARIDLVVDGARHGSNAKIGNLINMSRAIAHDVVILSDSDIAAPPGYFDAVVGALATPGVGAVSCLYRGRGDAGFWSRLAAANISYQFLPNVLVSLALDTGGACMGSTIALRRATLDRIGGFARFADVLADDHAIGAAVRGLGLRVAVPPLLVVHASRETSLGALFRQEVRWAATIRDLHPLGYLGSVITMPLAFALIADALRPGVATALLIVGAIAARIGLAARVDRLAGARTASYWLLPARELLSFAIFVVSLFVRSVDWRGQRLAMIDQGRIAAKSGATA